MRANVLDPAVMGVLSTFESPPGRKPSEALVLISTWFSALADADRRHVASAMRLAAQSTLFGVLAVLDGVRSIDDPPHGELVLSWRPPHGTVSSLNPEDMDLHDLLEGPVLHESSKLE